MASFRTSAIIELVDKTKAGASSVIRNFGRLEKAADGFGREADKSADKATLSFKQFEFEQKKAQSRLNDLRRDLRSGKGDFNDIDREIDEVSASLQKLNRENNSFRIGQNIGSGIRDAAGIARIAGGFAVAAGGAGFALTNSFAQSADEAGRLAENLGFSVDSFTALRGAIQLSSGAENAERLADAIRDFTVRRGELRRGEGELANLNKQLVSILLSAEDNEDAFVKFLRAASQIEDAADKAFVFDKAFGGAGDALLAFANEGERGMAELIQRSQELGLSIDDIDVGNAREFTRAFRDFKGSLTGLKSEIGTQLDAPLSEFIDRATTGLSGLTGLLRESFGDDPDTVRRRELTIERRKRFIEEDGPILGFLRSDASSKRNLTAINNIIEGEKILDGFEGSTSPLLPGLSRNEDGAVTFSPELITNSDDTQRRMLSALEAIAENTGTRAEHSGGRGLLSDEARIDASLNYSDNEISAPRPPIDIGQERMGIE